MNVRFLQAAEIELDQAVTFYEMQRRGLGREFLLEACPRSTGSLHIQRRGKGWTKTYAVAA